VISVLVYAAETWIFKKNDELSPEFRNEMFKKDIKLNVATENQE